MKNHNLKYGQSLVSLIVFVAIAISIITAAVISSTANTSAASLQQQTALTEQAAQSGMENALLMLLRNPDYTGETITINNIQVTTVIAGDNIHKTITTTASRNDYQRKILSKITYNNNIMTLDFWQETL